MKLSLSNRELMVQRSPINKNKFQIADAHMVWAEKIVCETIHFIITLKFVAETSLSPFSWKGGCLNSTEFK